MTDPIRPGEVPHSVSLAELAGHAHRHDAALFDHRHGMAPLTDQDRAGHALSALACRAALADRAQSGRWVLAVEALDAGATHAQVADAMGLDVEELHGGGRSWARAQLRLGLMSDERYEVVIGLLGERAEADPREHLPTWQLRRFLVLVDALGDPGTTLAERASLLIVARQDQATVDNLAALLRRARGAER